MYLPLALNIEGMYYELPSKVVASACRILAIPEMCLLIISIGDSKNGDGYFPCGNIPISNNNNIPVL